MGNAKYAIQKEEIKHTARHCHEGNTRKYEIKQLNIKKDRRKQLQGGVPNEDTYLNNALKYDTAKWIWRVCEIHYEHSEKINAIHHTNKHNEEKENITAMAPITNT